MGSSKILPIVCVSRSLRNQNLTTLFALLPLLLWDIKFANILGAHETPFQDPPPDLCEDTFYYARKDLIRGNTLATLLERDQGWKGPGDSPAT